MTSDRDSKEGKRLDKKDLLSVGQHVIYMDHKQTFEGVIVSRTGQGWRILLDVVYRHTRSTPSYAFVYVYEVMYLNVG